jgi:hypothetical protein
VIGLFQSSVAVPLVLYTFNGSVRAEEHNIGGREVDVTGGE